MLERFVEHIAYKPPFRSLLKTHISWRLFSANRYACKL